MIRKISLFLLTLPASAAALAESKINMPQGVTEVSRDIYGLHMLIFLVCCAIAVFVFGWMIIALVLHRKSRGVEPAKFSHSTKAEIIWTVIPIGILIGMAIPSAETLVKIEDSRNPDITVKVTGYQWKWHYEYLDEGVEFYSNLARSSNEARRLGSGIDPASVPNYLLEVDNPMVVPVGAKVRVLITSNDVIHAWWMKDFGIKKDAIPGFINEAWFRAEEPGVYRGQCAELCGKDHGFMPIVVEVLDRAEYEGWVAARQEEQGVSPKLAAAPAAE
ncbi:cytochrome c oxidase subunit II [Lentisalinibacter sediminis]|uniref:cytochrome c oxidase subunit II n=1 Tax=Lentisalinibacter sediminis TaxID=2992237 RepID=UPI0038676347